jgi:hypothetical protein
MKVSSSEEYPRGHVSQRVAQGIGRRVAEERRECSHTNVGTVEQSSHRFDPFLPCALIGAKHRIGSSTRDSLPGKPDWKREQAGREQEGRDTHVPNMETDQTGGQAPSSARPMSPCADRPRP